MVPEDEGERMVGRSNQVYRVGCIERREEGGTSGSEQWEPAAVVQRVTLKLREGWREHSLTTRLLISDSIS